MPYASDVQIRANTWAACRGRGRQSSVPVRHVFARIFARIPRIWGHVFRDPDPRIFRVLSRERFSREAFTSGR